MQIDVAPAPRPNAKLSLAEQGSPFRQVGEELDKSFNSTSSKGKPAEPPKKALSLEVSV
jgi:hypothetical protein